MDLSSPHVATGFFVVFNHQICYNTPNTGRVGAIALSARLSIKDRLLASIKIDAKGCWRWQKHISKTGYGQIWITTGFQRGSNLGAHRESYKAFKGTIKPNYQIDHLCKVRDCINPAHLEAVTAKENVARSDGLPKQEARRTHCPKGHEYSKANTYRRILWNGSISRQCKECGRISSKLRSRARRLAYAT